MLKVVSDSSPLMNLAGIGRLYLVNEQFGEVVIPPSVWNEIVLNSDMLPGSSEVKKACDAGWISIAKPDNTAVVDLLGQGLHRGEAEAIALAVELHSSLILLDDADARMAATTLGLRKTGVIGILIKAKRDGKIESLRQELNALMDRMGFYIDDELYRQALSSVGEKSD
ncbi:MAG: DUF3368 domain-containing protein [Methanomicrobiales archaeon]